MITVLPVFMCLSCQKPEPALKDAFREYFYIGAAVNARQILGQDSLAHSFILKQFNSITDENCLKWERIHPFPDQYRFTLADSMVSFGYRNGLFVAGHTLIWHQQTPDWVFEDSMGNPLSRDSLLQRMQDHIFTVVGRYKGKVNGWDVVNEAIDDNGQLRKSRWLDIIGADYIEKAFQFAREADPDAELYLNDYNIESNGKREGAIQLIEHLQDEGVRIDGIGIQGHWHLDTPDINVIDSAIQIFAGLGLKVMITELDINVLPRPENISGADISQDFELQKQLNPYPDNLPDSVQQKLADRYAEIFKVFVKNADKISRVTFWGTHDAVSWKNNWPVRGRTNYPLLFDRNYQPKPAFYAVIATAK